MRILIAGASGFIGKNFIKSAHKEWEIWGIYRSNSSFPDFAHDYDNVTAVKCDLSNISDVQSVSSKIPGCFDVIIFVWGNSDIALSIQDPIMDLKSNYISLINLFSCIKTHKFIFMSSGTVYMGHTGGVNPDVTLSPNSPYGINKLACELYIRFLTEKTERIKGYVNIRFFGAYGPMEPSRKIFTNLIKVFCMENKNEYMVSGDGKNYIDAMHIDDLMEALKNIILSNSVNVTVDLCYGRPITIEALVREIADILGVNNLQLSFQGESREPITFFASPERFQRFFGFKANIPLESGMLRFKDYLLRGE